jgi:hypothetical protein
MGHCSQGVALGWYGAGALPLIPPLAEQRRIVAKVDQLKHLVDQLETQLAASCAAVECCMDNAKDTDTLRML